MPNGADLDGGSRDPDIAWVVRVVHLASREIVPGFTRRAFQRLTTPELSRVIADIIQRHPDLRGVWHVAGDPINKFDLLTIVNDAFGLGSRSGRTSRSSATARSMRVAS
jgi:dTDP-4-dehydrorhamnose reductase